MGKVFSVLLIAGLILIIYFNPTEEILKCNENYECTVERTFISFIKTKTKFKINSGSIIYLTLKNHCGRTGCHPTYKTDFDDKIYPFIVDFESSVDKNEILNNFYEYRNNPEKRYYQEGGANPVFTYLCIFIYILFLFCFINRK